MRMPSVAAVRIAMLRRIGFARGPLETLAM
jgi:hypothetical protein